MSDLIKHYLQLVGIAKTWATKNLPGWSDESHRDLLQRHGAVAIDGRISASSMNMPQLAAALEDYERRGWVRQRVFNAKDGGSPSTGSVRTETRSVPPRIAFMVRMWGRLGKAGLVEDASRKALLVWCARQTAHAVPDLDSLTVAECQKISEAMKGWLARA